MKYKKNNFFVIFTIVIISLIILPSNIFAQRDRQKKVTVTFISQDSKTATPIPTESTLILPNEFKDNYPYKIVVRFYVSGDYKDRQLIVTVPLKIGEMVRGTLDYDSINGRMSVYIKGNLVATKSVKRWDLPKITYGYGVKFKPEQSGTVDFLFTPEVSASSVDEYEVFDKYDSTRGLGIKIYHRRK